MATGDTIQKWGARSALTISGFNSLAGGGWATSSALDISAAAADDVAIDVEVADIVEASLKQLRVYLAVSMDGSNFSHIDGANNPTALYPLGIVPMNGTGTWRQSFSVLAALGFLPVAVKVVVVNDNGTTALAASGNALYYTPLYHNVSP